ncbi:uncharacterized protein LOC103985615 [Musa acuminata AAA Group]|uniref:uncharacterized protein LOC103985615 n=1 Tax=Musa acuminata AAA Group TaxID=214697 RepID=UPI0031E4658C
MEFGDRQETRLVIDDGWAVSSSSSSSSFPPFASTSLCRICHEEEEESSTSMESPCACSGTLKFAHRECIQRWCDEKGSNVCEICLQIFEPGYTFPEKKAKLDVAVTIRGSLEIPRPNYDPENQGFVIASDDAAGSNYPECSAASSRSVSCCRYVAIMFTIMLLIRHFITVTTVGADQFPFSIATVFLLRASGIILPFYLVMQFISAVQLAQRQYQIEQLHRRINSGGLEEEDEIEHHPIRS